MPRMRLSVEGRGKHLANQHEYRSVLVYLRFTNAATATAAAATEKIVFSCLYVIVRLVLMFLASWDLYGVFCVFCRSLLKLDPLR